MDGPFKRTVQQLDVSTLAGRITRILADGHESAVRQGDQIAAESFDVDLDTIYYASLLLMIGTQTGAMRDRRHLIAALRTIDHVSRELQSWLERAA